ncbi:MAG TPA: GAF domain-containing protein [Thermoflexia bacterium]|nr:GAF domain-containing protein [Thermoflexia bacterium]
MSARDGRQQKQDFVSFATLEKLLEVGQSLILVRDLEGFLKQIAEIAGTVTGADIIVLYEYHEETKDVNVPPVVWGDIRHPDVLRERGRIRPHKESAVFKMLSKRRKRPFYAPDARRDWSRLMGEWPRKEGKLGDFLLREGIVSSVAVPLRAGKERVGVLFVNYRTRHAFQSKERKIIELIATQAAIAIHNASLFAQMQQRTDAMDLLQQVSAKISMTLNVEETLGLIIRNAMRLTRTDSGVIHLVDETKQTVTRSYEVPEGFGHLPPRLSQKKGMTWAVVSTGKTITVSDVTEDERVNPAMAEKGAMAIIGMPLKVENQTIGVLFLNDSELHEFTDYEKELLTTLANQAATAIQNARLYEENKGRLKLLDVLHETSLNIVQRLDLEKLMPAIIRRAAMLMAGEGHEGIGAAYWWCDYETQKATIEYSPNPDLVGVELDFNEGLVGEVIKTGRAKYVNNYPEWAQHAAIFDEENLAGLVENVIDVPVQEAGKVVAVLAVSDASGQRPFNDTDVELLERFAGLAAIAIQNARLHKDLRRWAEGLEMLNRVVGQISTLLDRQEIFQAIVEATRTTLGTTHCTLFVLDDNQVLAPQATDGVPFELIEGRRFHLGEGLAGWVAQKGTSALVTDASKDPRFSPGMTAKPGAPRSMVLAPLRVEGKVIGVISADQDRVAAFDGNDQRLLNTLSVQAGIAIYNADLLKQEQQRADTLDLLQRVSATISAVTSIEESLPLIAEGAVQLTRTDATSVIHLFDQAGREIIQSYEFPEKFGLIFSRFSEKTGLTWKAFSTGQIVEILNVPQSKRVSQALARSKVKSVIGVPLKLRDHALGVLFVNTFEQHKFTADEKAILTMLAEQAAIAIENAGLFEKERDRADAMNLLQQVSAKISATLNVEETLGLIIRGAMQLTGTDSGVIHLVDETKQTITRSYEIPGGFGHLPPRLSQKKGMTWTTVSTGKTIAVSDIGKDERVNPAMAQKGARAIIGTPLKVEEETIGVLFLNDSEPHEFSEYEKELLSILASHAAIAIENARLYEQLDWLANRKVKDLRAVNEVGQILTSSIGLSEEQILELIHEQATQLMDTSDMYIALYEPDPEQPDEYNREKPEQSIIHGTVRFGLARDNKRRVDVEHEEGWGPRKAGRGLTEYVIRTRQSLRPSDVKLAYKTIAQDYIGKIPKSWMGVPMMAGNKVLGVVVLRNDEYENVYDKDDEDVLQTIASQSAIALQNARLVQQLEQRVQELDTLRELAEELSESTLLDVA